MDEVENRISTQFHHPARFHTTTTMMREPDDTYSRLHYDLCQALNMTQMGIVLQKAVDVGMLNKRMAELYHMQAGSLLAVMASDLDRGFSYLKGSRDD
jgi:hypothetical protein